MISMTSGNAAIYVKNSHPPPLKCICSSSSNSNKNHDRTNFFKFLYEFLHFGRHKHWQLLWLKIKKKKDMSVCVRVCVCGYKTNLIKTEITLLSALLYTSTSCSCWQKIAHITSMSIKLYITIFIFKINCELLQIIGHFTCHFSWLLGPCTGTRERRKISTHYGWYFRHLLMLLLQFCCSGVAFWHSCMNSCCYWPPSLIFCGF